MRVLVDAGADTRSMAIVHGALRRDLERARAELADTPYPTGQQRRALGEHLVWMMHFLHDHHTSEDSGLWPLVRERNAGAAALLATLEADHQRVEPAASTLTEAASTYARTTDDAPRLGVVAALAELSDVLLPHLDREVAEAMPVVAASISAREWNEWDERYNIRPKTLRELGLIGHWLLDGIDRDGYQLVTHLVPPVPRFVLVHGFARAYRRRAEACWHKETATALALTW